MDIALLRAKAAVVGIKEISGNANSVILKTDSINEAAVAKLTEGFGSDFVISALSATPQYVIRMKKGQTQAKIVSRLSKVL